MQSVLEQTEERSQTRADSVGRHTMVVEGQSTICERNRSASRNDKWRIYHHQPSERHQADAKRTS